MDGVMETDSGLAQLTYLESHQIIEKERDPRRGRSIRITRTWRVTSLLTHYLAFLLADGVAIAMWTDNLETLASTPAQLTGVCLNVNGNKSRTSSKPGLASLNPDSLPHTG